VLPAVQGRRTLMVELQAWSPTWAWPNPKRSVVGLDSGRLVMTLAVLVQHAELPVLSMDVFASVAGGIRVPEPAADLAVAMAVASAATGVALPADLAAVGRGRAGRRDPPGHQPAPAPRGVRPTGIRPGGGAGLVAGRAPTLS
jgi:DNA repair protein RadA/Sms